MGVKRNKEGSYGNEFRFEAKWCLDKSFEEMIKKWWGENSGNVLGKLEKTGRSITSLGAIE